MRKYFQNLLAKSLNVPNVSRPTKSRLSALYENLATEIILNEMLNQNSQNPKLPSIHKNSVSRLKAFISKYKG